MTDMCSPPILITSPHPTGTRPREWASRAGVPLSTSEMAYLLVSGKEAPAGGTKSWSLSESFSAKKQERKNLKKVSFELHKIPKHSAQVKFM